MTQWQVYYSGTSNLVTEFPIMAKSAKEAKLVAISLQKLNPLILCRLTARKYN
jgi:hypothetical protein